MFVRPKLLYFTGRTKHLKRSSFSHDYRNPFGRTLCAQPKRDKMSEIIVLWFRNNLRIRDNQMLHDAIERARKNPGTKLLPIFNFDSRWFGPNAVDTFGTARTGIFRANFIRESVIDLGKNLNERLGLQLLITTGLPEHVLPTIAEQLNGNNASGSSNAKKVRFVCQAETCHEEIQIEKHIDKLLEKFNHSTEQPNSQKVILNKVDYSTMYELTSLPKKAQLTYRGAFTPWRKQVEGADTLVPQELPDPASLGKVDMIDLDILQQITASLCGESCDDPLTTKHIHGNIPSVQWLAAASKSAQLSDSSNKLSKAVLVFRGGENAALERLQDWVFTQDCLKSYFDTRNGMLGANYSSKLSPWLACGCISARTVFWACKKYEKQRNIANKSTYWMIFELSVRDFFKFQSLRLQSNLFREFGEGMRTQEWESGQHATRELDLWKTGKTGWPLIDANMRELLATGFMSNRGRQNVASFLALDLRIDWRQGASHFEEYLLDYDPASNYCNWLACAGLNGGRVNHFNTLKQSRDYDSNGDYIRHWCPELQKVPTRFIHEPWKMSISMQQDSNCLIGEHYPRALETRFASPFQQGSKRSGKRHNRAKQHKHSNRHQHSQQRSLNSKTDNRDSKGSGKKKKSQKRRHRLQSNLY